MLLKFHLTSSRGSKLERSLAESPNAIVVARSAHRRQLKLLRKALIAKSYDWSCSMMRSSFMKRLEALNAHRELGLLGPDDLFEKLVVIVLVSYSNCLTVAPFYRNLSHFLACVLQALRSKENF